MVGNEGKTRYTLAVGADQGFIYLRARYPYVRNTLEQALIDARANGYLGPGILGSSFHFDIEMRYGFAS